MTTRKAARVALTAILRAAMTTCEEINSYYKSDSGAKSPVLCIHSLSTQAIPLTFQGSRPSYIFDIVVWVKRDGIGITEATAEDALDDVAAQLYTVIESHASGGAVWNSLTYSGRSTAIDVDLGGNAYWMEVTPLIMECASNS